MPPCIAILDRRREKKVARKHSGVGANTSAMIEEERIKDAMANLLPEQVQTAAIVPDSALKLKSKTTKAGNHGPELTTQKKLKAVGVYKRCRDTLMWVHRYI